MRKIIAATLILSGLVVWIIAYRVHRAGMEIGIFLGPFAIALGIGLFASAKRRSLWWMTLSFLGPPVGIAVLLVLILLSDKSPERLVGSRWFWERILPMVLSIPFFLIFLAITVPGYVKYIKPARTEDASVRAERICRAAMDWVGGGKVIDEKLFRARFPAESEWLMKGDSYYRYAVSVDGTQGSSPQNPVVVASSRNGAADPAVYGATVQAGGIGMKSGLDLSGCKSNVEYVSDGY
ncbi:MAG: hypothetical protein HY204_12245 [Nitrospirae bacterium]|nr:hypothetical protein [Nitrospirota bacterium]